MKTYIVDASVAIKWFVEEELRDRAVSFFDGVKKGKIKAVVPTLFFTEMSNICWKKSLKKDLTYHQASEILKDIRQMPLKRYEDYELFDVAFGNALQFGITVYDAMYVSLAEIYAVPLVTADDALIKACKGRFDFILPLDEVKK